MEMPVDVLNKELGAIRDNGDIDFDNTMAAVNIDTQLQEKFLFFPIEELETLAAEHLEEGRDILHLGQGHGYVSCTDDASPADLFTRAENALVLYWELKKRAEKQAEAEKLASRPEPGVYQGTHAGNKYFTVIVTEDRSVLVGQSGGGFDDYTTQWDENAGTSLAWTLQRINLTDGTITK